MLVFHPINRKKTDKMKILPSQEIIPKFVHCPRCKKAYQTRRNGQPVVFVINESISCYGAGFIDVDRCTMPSCKKREDTVLK